MRLSRTDLVPMLAIFAGGAVGVLTSASLVLSSRADDVPVAVSTVIVPDGQRIVYWSSDGRIEYRPKEDFTRDTPLEARIVFVPMSELIPMWSPDGSWVAFTRDGSREVWVVNADGGTPTRLTVNTLPKERR